MKGNAQEWLNSGRTTDILVSFDEILNYISWGIIFQDSPPLWDEAFRKIKPKYNSDYIELLSDLETEVTKLEKHTEIELPTFTDRQDDRDRVLMTKRPTENPQARSDRAHGAARQNTYKGFQGQKFHYQGNSHSRSSGHHKK